MSGADLEYAAAALAQLAPGAFPLGDLLDLPLAEALALPGRMREAVGG